MSHAWPYSEVQRPHANASKPTRRLRRAARSARVRSCEAARSGSLMVSGDVFEQHSIKGAPMACIRSNLRSARSRLRWNCASGMPSKSRNGWYRSIVSPRSSVICRSSVAEPLKWMKSFSNSSMPSKPAAAMASSFCRRVPDSETVAMDRCMWITSMWPAARPARQHVQNSRPAFRPRRWLPCRAWRAPGCHAGWLRSETC